MTEPHFHDDADHRAQARRMRDGQWAFADRVAKLGTVWLCWWNKNRHHKQPYPDDLEVCGLIDGMELLSWLRSHDDWWVIGEWDDARYAAPVQLTEVGREALRNRELYDLEPVDWGLVEPGHRAIPAEKEPACAGS